MIEFEIVRSDDQFLWRIRASNGEILASSERYKRRSDARHAVELVMANAATALVDDQTED